jgi:hypothetical protein
MEHFLRGREFEDIDHVEAACQEFFNSKEPYHRGIELLGRILSTRFTNQVGMIRTMNKLRIQ